MNREDQIESDIDDPYRKCEVCEIVYHEEFGHTCDECDVWICNNCWPEHMSIPEHP
jgi:hypothetical protein